jgi:hypothetical protein
MPDVLTPQQRHRCMSYTSTYSSPMGMIVLESDGKALTGLRFV